MADHLVLLHFPIGTFLVWPANIIILFCGSSGVTGRVRCWFQFILLCLVPLEPAIGTNGCFFYCLKSTFRTCLLHWFKLTPFVFCISFYEAVASFIRRLLYLLLLFRPANNGSFWHFVVLLRFDADAQIKFITFLAISQHLLGYVFIKFFYQSCVERTETE